MWIISQQLFRKTEKYQKMENEFFDRASDDIIIGYKKMPIK